MTYPHRYVAAAHEEHLQCRCNPRYLVHRGNIQHVRHDDGSATAEEGGNCAAAMHERIAEAVGLLACLVDDEACRFDHHRGCQTHGFPFLDGAPCPMATARALIATHKGKP